VLFTGSSTPAWYNNRMRNKYILIGIGVTALIVLGVGKWFLLKNAVPATPLQTIVPPQQKSSLSEDITKHPEFIFWFSQWQNVTPSLSLEEFYRQTEGQIRLYSPGSSRKPSEEELQSSATQRYLFSPDKKKFINYLASLGEPDSSVDIYNRMGDRMLETLLFCGTPCTFYYAFWIDNNRFVILGITEVTLPDGNQKCDIPNNFDTCYDQLTVDFYDLTKNTQIRYLSAEHIFPQEWVGALFHANLIRVTMPKAHAMISSPLIVKGEARGSWFFEASFPVRLFDANGNEIAVQPAQAQGEWMTENFVPFTAVLRFAAPATNTGTLVFEKDNPSGLPEHSDELRIPVRFR